MSKTNVVKGYKVFKPDWTCREKQYKVGETATQDGKLELCENGIHFCTKIEDCFRYYDVDPKYKMAEVEAIGDIMYSYGDSKCCTNKLRIVREISIQELLDNEKSFLKIFHIRENALRYVNSQKICLAAVKQNRWALKYVKEQTPDICLEAVKQNGRLLYYVKEQTPEICLEAVKENGEALEFVKDQTPEICLEAVKQDGWALYWVKEQIPEICLAAIIQNQNAKRFIHISI